MHRSLTPIEMLTRRINREFPKKKLIGDIVINDEEFDLLISCLQMKYRYMYSTGQHEIIDPTFCVALVQIGIRYYDGNYWSHVKQLLGYKNFNANHQGWLGLSFIATMKKYDKLQLGESDRVNAILMHSFVSNLFAEKFFNFLFAFYRIDLDRDIKRLDRTMMSELVDIMMRHDNTGRTYWLVEHTADAVRNNTRGSKTRIRRFLNLIDKAFWGEQLPDNSQNRLTMRFIVWKDQSEDFISERNSNRSISHKRRKSFSSPYIKYIGNNGSFELILPPQIIRFQDFTELFWCVNINGNYEKIEINPYNQGVTGYKTDEEILAIPKIDILAPISVELMDGNTRIRSFRIVGEPIRFFDMDGFYIHHDLLSPGQLFSFSSIDFAPTSEAIIDTEYIGDWLYTSFDLMEGDIIRLPDGRPISVGRKIQEGLLPRGIVCGAVASIDDEKISVYSAAPSFLVKIIPQHVPGTAVKINGKLMRIFDDHTLVSGISEFDLFDRSGESGYLIDLSKLGCCENGLYDVCIDVPNDRSERHCRFLLINSLSFYFEDAPYVFKNRGTLCIPKELKFRSVTGDAPERMEGYNNFNFEIEAGESYLFLDFCGINIGFEIPAFSYRFVGDEWQIDPCVDIWHESFQPQLQIKYHTDKIKIYIDDDDEYEDESIGDHEESFIKNKSKDIFECDLNRFCSWFGRDTARRQIYLDLPGVEKPIRFFGVITKSILLSGFLKGDFYKNCLICKFDIVGQSTYFVDLLFNGHCIVEKAPLTEGMLVIESELKSGKYSAHIFEAEEEDSGFGDQVYYEIGKKELDLLNPHDLNGKSIEISSIRPANTRSRYLQLDCTYKVMQLKSNHQDDINNYCGKMIVENNTGKILTTFPVNVEFYDFEELRYSYITFYDDDETVEFLYDEVRHIIVKNEDTHLSKSQAYRRYKQSLYPEDYIFEVNYIDSGENVGDFGCGVRNNLNSSQSTEFSSNQSIFTNSITENITVEDMKLTAKSSNCLLHAHIYDSEAIKGLSYSDLLKIRDLGVDGIKEVCEKMKQLGYDEWVKKVVYEKQHPASSTERISENKIPSVLSQCGTTFNSNEISKTSDALSLESEEDEKKEADSDPKLSDTDLLPMTYNCLKNAGLVTKNDLQNFLQEKGIKGLNNINKMNAKMREEVVYFARSAKFI